MAKKQAAVIGSGNIGTDLIIKLLRSELLEPALLVGIDPGSDGLARARELGVGTTHDGIDGLFAHPAFADIAVVFDATSAAAHLAHAPKLKAAGKACVDMTPAAVGPYAVPVVNLQAILDEERAAQGGGEAPNVNMVTCGGQATIPMVAAMRSVAEVAYAEIVASI